MTFSVIVTKTSFSSDSNIPTNLDPLIDLEAGDPLIGAYYMPTTYNGFNSSGTFSVSVVFGEEGAEQILNPTFISPASIQLGLTATSTSNSFTISGKAADEFAGSYYQFAMKDKSIRILPPDTTEDFYALVRYKMPVPTFLEVQHSISIGIPTDPITMAPPTTSTIVISQWCLWNYYPVTDYVEALSPQRV